MAEEFEAFANLTDEEAAAVLNDALPPLTVEGIHEAMAKAAPGAQELSDSLRAVFGAPGDLRLGAGVPLPSGAKLVVPAGLVAKHPGLADAIRGAADVMVAQRGPDAPAGDGCPTGGIAAAEGVPARAQSALEGVPTPSLPVPPMVASLDALKSWQPPTLRHSASEVSANPVDNNPGDQLPLIPVVEVVEKPRALSEGQQIARLIAVYVTAWQDRYQTDGRPDVGKVSRGILQRCLRDRTMEQLALLLQVYCQMETAWFETKAHDLATFEKNLNVIALAMSKGQDPDAVDIEGILRRQEHKKQAAIAAGVELEETAAITAGSTQ